MIPAVAEKQLAEFCDVFCEKGYFNYDQSLKILETAKKYGIMPRIHADEFVDSGGAKLAAEVRALSADHLMAISDDGISAIEEAFKGVTWNAAKSLNRHLNNGIIKNEYYADFILWDIESLDEIPYWFGNDRIVSVYKNGLQIYSRS